MVAIPIRLLGLTVVLYSAKAVPLPGRSDPGEDAAATETVGSVTLDDSNTSVDFDGGKLSIRVDASDFGRIGLELRSEPGLNASVQAGTEERQDFEADFSLKLMTGRASVVDSRRGKTVGEAKVVLVFDTVTRSFAGEFKIGELRYKMEEDSGGSGMMTLEVTRVDSSPPLETGRASSSSVQGTSSLLWRRNSHTNLPYDHNVCPMRVTVDNVMFSDFGGDVKSVIKFVLKVVEGSNRIYRDNGPLLQHPDDEARPLKFTVRSMFVATDDFCRGRPSSYLCGNWTNDYALLTALSEQEDTSAYCLGVVFTGCNVRPRYGVAFIGCVCCGHTTWSDPTKELNFVNSGLVALYNMTRGKAEYVLAHEIGHILAAQHDPTWWADKYLMYPWVPETLVEANERFSISTLDTINANLYRTFTGDPVRAVGDLDGFNFKANRSWCFVDSKGRGLGEEGDPPGEEAVTESADGGGVVKRKLKHFRDSSPHFVLAVLLVAAVTATAAVVIALRCQKTAFNNKKVVDAPEDKADVMVASADGTVYNCWAEAEKADGRGGEETPSESSTCETDSTNKSQGD